MHPLPVKDHTRKAGSALSNIKMNLLAPENSEAVVH